MDTPKKPATTLSDDALLALLTNKNRRVRASGRLAAAGALDALREWVEAEKKALTDPADCVVVISDVLAFFAGYLLYQNAATRALGPKGFEPKILSVRTMVERFLRDHMVSMGETMLQSPKGIETSFTELLKKRYS